MREGRPSATAELVAIRRAVHQLLDRPLVFEDPLALAIVGRGREAQIREDPFRAGGGTLGTALRAHLVVRSRVAEEQLAAAVARGVRVPGLTSPRATCRIAATVCGCPVSDISSVRVRDQRPRWGKRPPRRSRSKLPANDRAV